MWMIQILQEDGFLVFRPSGRLQQEQLADLHTVLESRGETENVAIDLSDVKLVGREVVSFLAQREREGAQLRNCPAYIREWIANENTGRQRDMFLLHAESPSKCVTA